MNFLHVFKRKKKKAETKGPVSEPAKAPLPPPHQEATTTHANERREWNLPRGGGNYMEELDRMSRYPGPGMRNLEVTTSRTFRWNFGDGREYEYNYQDQGPSMPHHYGGWMQRPPAGLPPCPPPQFVENGPPGRLPVASFPHYYDAYDYGGTRSVYGYYPYGSSGYYYEDEYPPDCCIM